MHPIPGAPVTCAYGTHGHYWGGLRHRGIDFAAPVGTRVLCPWGGTVVGVGTWGRAFGAHSPVIDFDRLPDGSPGLWGILAHLDQVWVEPGDRVEAGDPVGTVGMLGQTTGPHLHFEVQANRLWSPWYRRKDRDPRPWVTAMAPVEDRRDH